jgi:hypothetical protein
MRREELSGEVSGSQIEQSVDELILLANISPADSARLSLADQMQRLVSRNRSLSCAELAKALLGLHASFDRSMILLQDVVQILDRSMPAAGSRWWHPRNRWPDKVTPTALHTNVGLIDPPGFVGRLELTAQPLFQCGTVTLYLTPERRVIRLQTALGEQLFDIAQREQIPKIPAYGTKNHLWRRLPPFEDCCRVAFFTVFSRYQIPPPKLRHIPPA